MNILFTSQLNLDLRNVVGIENDEPAREDQFDDDDEDADVRHHIANRVFHVHHHHHHHNNRMGEMERIDDMDDDDDEEDEEEDDYDDLSNSGGSNAEHDEESTSEDERPDDSQMPETEHEASAMEIDASAIDDDRSSSSDQMEHDDDHMPNRIEVQIQRMDDAVDETIRDIDEEEEEEEDEEEENDTEAEDAEDGIEEFFEADYLEHDARHHAIGGAPRVATIRDGAAFMPPPDSFFDTDFEMLANSASYFADFIAQDGRRHLMTGLPRDFGVALRSVGGPIGIMPAEADPVVSHHPLLSRPPLAMNPPAIAERQASDNDNLASMHNYALRTILIGDSHDTVTIGLDRDMHHGRRYPVQFFILLQVVLFSFSSIVC